MKRVERIEVRRPSREQVVSAIESVGSLKEAAQALGVSRMTLWRWTRELEIEVRTVLRVA
jgi:molybdenum-dependent DNA-binding transcriptional regulator ModE